MHIGDENDYLIWERKPGRTVEIVDIRAGSERRRGIGRRMVAELLRGLRPGTDSEEGVTLVYALTRWSNAIAHQFYEACGFRMLGRLHYFYADGSAGREHCLVWGIDL